MDDYKYFIDDKGTCIIPDGTTDIEELAFNGCTSLEAIVIPNSVTAIGERAFCGCVSLEHINISNSEIKFGKDVFRGCISLKKPNFIFMDEQVFEIGIEEIFKNKI